MQIIRVRLWQHHVIRLLNVNCRWSLLYTDTLSSVCWHSIIIIITIITVDLRYGFYHAMHYTAKRSLAITCRLSICLSVTLVDHDHIGWKSWKLTARTISPTSSLFIAQRSSTYSQGNMENSGETRGGVGKSGVLEHKSGNISEMR